MANKHTPGPWDVFPKENTTSVYCDDDLGNRIADCNGKFSTLPIEQRRANAILIAAAPDMLKALQDIAGIEAWISDSELKKVFASRVYSAIEKATKIPHP